MRLLLLAALPLGAARGQSAPIYAAKLGLEGQVLNLARGFDPDAVVHVRLKTAQLSDEPLPATPFAAKSLELVADGAPRISSIEIDIYTSAVLPDPVKEMIIDSGRQLGAIPRINIKDPLAGYKAPLVPMLDRTPKSADTSKDASTTPDPLASLDLKLESLFSKVSTPLRPAAVAIVAAMCAVPILILGALVVAILSIRKQSQTMTQHAAKLAAAIEQAAAGAGSAGGPAAFAPDRAVAAAAERPASAAEGEQITEALRELSDDSVKALLFDCYWSSVDGYAGFLWRRLSIVRRREILTAEPQLKAYVDFLSGTAEVNLGLDSDPYYLSPLAINHLDNLALTEAVRRTPPLLRRLPSIRIERLTLSASERLALEGVAGGDGAPFDLSQLAPSEARSLRKRIKIRVASDEDEEKLLAQDDPGLDAMESIPSLVWTRFLADDSLAELLLECGANDLALAWIAPQPVLSRFEQLLPERRRQMIKERAGRLKPSRANPAFEALHAKVVARIRSDRARSDAVASPATPRVDSAA